ncbi:MAG: hypothetical protein ABEI74_01390 [Candidatus Pacearchaeota archaeon]
MNEPRDDTMWGDVNEPDTRSNFENGAAPESVYKEDEEPADTLFLGENEPSLELDPTDGSKEDENGRPKPMVYKTSQTEGVAGIGSGERPYNEDGVIKAVKGDKEVSLAIDGMGGYEDGDKFTSLVEKAVNELLENNKEITTQSITEKTLELIEDSSESLGSEANAVLSGVVTHEGGTTSVINRGDARTKILDNEGNEVLSTFDQTWKDVYEIIEKGVEMDANLSLEEYIEVFLEGEEQETMRQIVNLLKESSADDSDSDSDIEQKQLSDLKKHFKLHAERFGNNPVFSVRQDQNHPENNKKIETEEGQMRIIATDGVWDNLDQQGVDIEEIWAESGGDPERAFELLLNKAEDGNKDDNYGLIVEKQTKLPLEVKRNREEKRVDSEVEKLREDLREGVNEDEVTVGSLRTKLDNLITKREELAEQEGKLRKKIIKLEEKKDSWLSSMNPFSNVDSRLNSLYDEYGQIEKKKEELRQQISQIEEEVDKFLRKVETSEKQSKIQELEATLSVERSIEDLQQEISEVENSLRVEADLEDWELSEQKGWFSSLKETLSSLVEVPEKKRRQLEHNTKKLARGAAATVGALGLMVGIGGGLKKQEQTTSPEAEGAATSVETNTGEQDVMKFRAANTEVAQESDTLNTSEIANTRNVADSDMSRQDEGHIIEMKASDIEGAVESESELEEETESSLVNVPDSYQLGVGENVNTPIEALEEVLPQNKLKQLEKNGNKDNIVKALAQEHNMSIEGYDNYNPEAKYSDQDLPQGFVLDFSNLRKMMQNPEKALDIAEKNRVQQSEENVQDVKSEAESSEVDSNLPDASTLLEGDEIEDYESQIRTKFSEIVNDIDFLDESDIENFRYEQIGESSDKQKAAKNIRDVVIQFINKLNTISISSKYDLDEDQSQKLKKIRDNLNSLKSELSNYSISSANSQASESVSEAAETSDKRAGTFSDVLSTLKEEKEYLTKQNMKKFTKNLNKAMEGEDNTRELAISTEELLTGLDEEVRLSEEQEEQLRFMKKRIEAFVENQDAKDLEKALTQFDSIDSLPPGVQEIFKDLDEGIADLELPEESEMSRSEPKEDRRGEFVFLDTEENKIDLNKFSEFLENNNREDYASKMEGVIKKIKSEYEVMSDIDVDFDYSKISSAESKKKAARHMRDIVVNIINKINRKKVSGDDLSQRDEKLLDNLDSLKTSISKNRMRLASN